MRPATTSSTSLRRAAAWRKRLVKLAAIAKTFTVCVGGVAFAGVADLGWTPPTTNTDGSPLTNLQSYRVYSRCGTGGSRLVATVPVPAVSYTVTELPDGVTCFFALEAVNSAGVSSARTGEVSKALPAVLPGDPVVGPIVTWRESGPVSLSGSVTSSTSSVTLSSVGQIAWARWPGYQPSVISDLTVTGVAQTYPDDRRLVNGSRSGVSVEPGAFEFSAPCAGERTLRVYVGGYWSRGRFTATLGGAVYTDEQGALNDEYSRVYTVRCTGEGELVVRWEQVGGEGNISIQGAALQ